MKDRFLEINALRKQIQDLFHRLEEKKKTMKDNYSDLVSSNESHFFGLDSFRFQVKLTENEITFLNDQFILIDNRLYCDYYKLYNHVYEYYVEHLPHGVVKNVYPIYKDLQPTKVYEPELIHKLYKDIILLIHKAYETLDHEHRKRESEKRLTTSGIHIGNYVHNRIFADTLIKTNIQLFEEYLNTYFIYHMTFLVNLKERLGLFLDHVLRKQPAEQGCNVVEVDDDFMRVAKSTNEQLVDPVIVLNSEIVKHDIQEEKIEPGESKSDDVIQIVIHSDGKPVEVAYPPIVEQVIDQVLETQVDAIIDQVIDQVIDTQITDQVVETPVEVDPETQVVTLNVSEETQTEPTIEEVFNPIIEHILGGSIASAVETAQAVETETAVETAPAAQAVETVPAVQPVSVPTKKKRPRKK